MSSSVALGLASIRLLRMLSWNKWVSWVTKLSIRRRFSVFTWPISRPEMVTCPCWVSQNRRNSFKRVDFPLPLRPEMPMTLCSGIFTDTPSSTVSPP